MLRAGTRCSLHRRLQQPRQWPQYRPYSSHKGSDKLFQDALKEETEEAERERAAKSSRLAALESEHTYNWDGEERMEDAVLRMLVDKYKPLRTGTGIKTAEQKLKQAPPKIASFEDQQSLPQDHTRTIPTSDAPASFVAQSPPPGQTWADVPLIKPVDGHRPWHTEYRAPSHAVASIKLGQISAYKPPAKPTPADMDDKTRRKVKTERKRVEHAGRLSRAKENTLDYKLGVKKGPVGPGGQVNPASLKGWTTLIEDQIEKARLSGAFNNVKGRGKPLAKEPEAANPFIAREEFLMNRIVQRHGASPPWVELQQDLNTAVTTFRETVRQAWVRRGFRMITSSNSLHDLPSFTVTRLESMRDLEWENKERSFHDTAIREINSLVTRYNGLAPYSVRRPFYATETEINAVYIDCAQEIEEKLLQRARDGGVHIPLDRGSSTSRPTGGGLFSESSGVGDVVDPTPQPTRPVDVWRNLLSDMRSAFRRSDRDV